MKQTSPKYAKNDQYFKIKLNLILKISERTQVSHTDQIHFASYINQYDFSVVLCNC